jgi:hypothetical protein
MSKKPSIEEVIFTKMKVDKALWEFAIKLIDYGLSPKGVKSEIRKAVKEFIEEL